MTSQKAEAGSSLAAQALAALSTLATDQGAALTAAAAAANPYAAAMVQLNDAGPSPAQIAANLVALGDVAAHAAAGTGALTTLIVSKAVAAIDTVAGFAPGDAANLGPATVLPAGVRVRVSADLYAVLSLGAIQTLFGTTITTFKAATGPDVLSGADIGGVLANRIDAAPGTPGVQELKEWMALLFYLENGLGGSIPAAYASTSDFQQFASTATPQPFGAAVTTRNASYPVADLEQLALTLSGLNSSP